MRLFSSEKDREDSQCEILEVTCATALSKSELPGLDYALNPYTGCTHGCIYCYASSILRKKEYAQNWGHFLRVKINIAERLKKQINRLQKGVVGIGTVTDPYQPAEEKYHLTRECINVFKKAKWPICVQTKNKAVLSDLKLLASYPKQLCEVGVTITSLNPYFSKKFEPKASLPKERINTLKKLYDAGIKTWAFLGPVIPGQNDNTDDLESLIKALSPVVEKILIDKLNLRMFVTAQMKKALKTSFKNPDAGWWQEKSQLIKDLCKQYNVRCENAF